MIILAGREILHLPRPPLWEGKPGATHNTQEHQGTAPNDNKTDTSFNVLWSTQESDGPEAERDAETDEIDPQADVLSQKVDFTSLEALF